MIREGSLSPSSSRTKGVFEPLDRGEVIDMWRSRFGTPEDTFEGYSFYRKSQSIWVFSNAALPRLSYETIGLRMISLNDMPWKPTTCALQIFGRHATKNILHLNSEQAKAFMAGESQVVTPNCELSPELGPGYVVVFYRGEVLGCGLYSREGKLISQLPKERRMSFAEGDDI